MVRSSINQMTIVKCETFKKNQGIQAKKIFLTYSNAPYLIFTKNMCTIMYDKNVVVENTRFLQKISVLFTFLVLLVNLVQEF
jgi:hypothetical protein